MFNFGKIFQLKKFKAPLIETYLIYINNFCEQINTIEFTQVKKIFLIQIREMLSYRIT